MSGILESAASVSRALSKLTKAQKQTAISAALQSLNGTPDPVAQASATVAKVLKPLTADDQKQVVDFVTNSVNREEDSAPAGSPVEAAAAPA